MLRVAQFASERVERPDVVVRALHVAQPLDKGVDGGGVGDAGGLEALPGSCSQGVEISGTSDADDRQVEAVVSDERNQSGEDLFERQVPCRAEEDDGVGPLAGLRLPLPGVWGGMMGSVTDHGREVELHRSSMTSLG